MSRLYQYPEVTELQENDVMMIDREGNETAKSILASKVAPALMSKTITERGVYKASDDGVRGYNEVNVDIPYTDVHVASGAIATFEGEDLPLKSLTASIVPVQAGSGDPSPTNVRPITGWTEEVISVCGKNYLNTIQDNVVMINGEEEASPVISNQSITYNIPEGAYFFLLKAFKIERCHVGKTYVMSYNITPNSTGYTRFVICNTDGSGRQEKALTATITDADVGKLLTVRFYPKAEGNYTITNIQVEEGSTATTYEPYAGTTTTIPFTDGQGQSVEVFGGSVDVVNGGEQPNNKSKIVLENLTTTEIRNFTTLENCVRVEYYPMRSMGKPQADYMCDKLTPYSNTPIIEYQIGRSASETDTRCFISLPLSVESLTDAITMLNTMKPEIVYELATPTTFYTQPTSIKSLDGVNNLWASTGDVDVEYQTVWVRPTE
jgi:hypothetical protein